MNDFEQREPDCIKCPWCLEVYTGDPWESHNDDNEKEIECEECGKTFLHTAEHSTTYVTTRKPCEDDKHDLPDEPRHSWHHNITYNGELLPKKEWEWIEARDCKVCEKTVFKYHPYGSDVYRANVGGE